MGSESESESIKLPIINFSEVEQDKGSSLSWDYAKKQVRSALENFGCFEAKFDQISQNLAESVIGGMEQLFELPLENKLRNGSNKPYHGYIGQYADLPLYESLGIQNPVSTESVQKFCSLLWSEDNPDFSKNIQSFSEKLSELDKMVRKLVLESLGLQKYIEEHLESTDYLVRVQKYDAPKSPEVKFGLTPHTDKNFVTILYQNEVNGLEIQTKNGYWIAAEPSLNSFIVMIGEAFHAWTNGRLHPTQHKVMMKGDVPRYSIGLFSVPKDGYIIKAPEEMIDEEHPLLFKPFDHFKFLDFFYSAAGQRSPAALKDYCGA